MLIKFLFFFPKFIYRVSVWKSTKRTQHFYLADIIRTKKYTIHERKGSDHQGYSINTAVCTCTQVTLQDV